MIGERNGMPRFGMPRSSRRIVLIKKQMEKHSCETHCVADIAKNPPNSNSAAVTEQNAAPQLVRLDTSRVPPYVVGRKEATAEALSLGR